MEPARILVLDRGETLAEMIDEVVAASTLAGSDVIRWTKVSDALAAIDDLLPLDVLVAGPSLGTRAGVTRLQKIRDAHPGLPMVLSFGSTPKVALRDVVRIGALDFLAGDVEEDELGQAIERAVDLGRRAAPAAVAIEPSGPEVGRVFTVASATGGCGKTFFATNLAYFLARSTGKRACIIDLDLQFGEVSTALRLRPRYTIYDALHREAGDDLQFEDDLDEFLIEHETGVFVLPAPKDPAEADQISPADVARAVDAIRARFDFVIIDTPGQLNEVVLAAFDLSEKLYVMVTLDLPSVRNMSVFLSTLEKLKMPAEDIRLILNKAESDVGLEISEVEKVLPAGFAATLPYAKEVHRSINLGMPVLAASPETQVSRLLAASLVELLPEEQRAAFRGARLRPQAMVQARGQGGRTLMKLSDRLAAAKQAEADAAAADTAAQSSGPRRRTRREAPTAEAAAATKNWQESKRKVRQLVLQELGPRMVDLHGAALTAEVRSALDRCVKREDVSISPAERRKFVQELIQDTLGYGPLDPLLQDQSVSEIMCNAHDDIWVERAGQLHPTDAAFANPEQYRQVIEKIVSAVGRRIDESSPMVDARLPDGSRVNAILPPLAIHGAVLTIRKFAADPLQAKDLVSMGTFTLDAVTVLEACVRGKLNVLVSGGTGTGKTTNLNVLSSFIPAGERIITIEDSAELQLQQPHTISLEARPPNAEGSGEVRIRDLVKNSLRMRPDRIVVGEVRGAEALDMLQAMNTGHEGSMTTVHANSPRDALSRIETMVFMAGYDLPIWAIREQIASAIDVIIHLERLPDGRRVVAAVTEVQGLEGDTILLQDVFLYQVSPGQERGTGRLEATGLRPQFLDRLTDAGIQVPASSFRPSPRPAAVTKATKKAATATRRGKGT